MGESSSVRAAVKDPAPYHCGRPYGTGLPAVIASGQAVSWAATERQVPIGSTPRRSIVGPGMRCVVTGPEG